MHARIDHLLSLRDGEPVDAQIAAHVEHCPSCTAQLHRLQRMRAELQSLPQPDAPISFERIRLVLSRPEQRKRAGARGYIAAASLLVLVAIVFVAARDERAPTRVVETVPQPHVETAHVAELVAQSQQLEHLLQRLPERPRVERVSTAATIETIEQRIQWLDLQLSYAPDSGLSEEQARRLWRERVDLMDSLVKVRYAEGVSF